MIDQETQAYIDQAINTAIKQAQEHKHTGLDAPRIRGQDLNLAPQSAVTADIGTTAGATYTVTEQALINNTHTRLNDVVTKLKNLGLTR